MASIASALVVVAISAHGRPTENVLRVVGDDASVSIDLFHGFAIRHAGAVSRRAKIVHPFVASGRQLRGASSNIVRRAARREPAYPGLRELVREFYEGVRGAGPAPFTPASILDVAATRDVLIEKLLPRPEASAAV